MMRNRAWVCLPLFFSIGTLEASTPLGARNWGDPRVQGTAKVQSMGGASAAGLGEPSDLNANPAALSLFSSWDVSLTGGLEQTALDEFLADEPARSVSFAHASVGEASLAFPVKPWRMAFGLSLASWSDLSWEGTRTLFSAGAPIGSQRLESRGTIFSLTPALSWTVFQGESSAAAVGLGTPLYFGRQNTEFERVQNQVTDAAFTHRQSFRGVGETLGFLGSWENFRAGFSVQPPFELTADFDQTNSTTGVPSSGSHVWRFPWSYRIGISYQAADPWRTVLSLEADQNFLNRFRVDGRSVQEAGLGNLFSDSDLRTALGAGPFRSYQTVTEWRVGVEHWVRENIPLRYGIALVPSYSQKAVQQTLLTIGSGAKIGKSWRWDGALVWGFRDYFGDGLYHAQGQRVREEIRRLTITFRRAS